MVMMMIEGGKEMGEVKGKYRETAIAVATPDGRRHTACGVSRQPLYSTAAYRTCQSVFDQHRKNVVAMV